MTDRDPKASTTAPHDCGHGGYDTNCVWCLVAPVEGENEPTVVEVDGGWDIAYADGLRGFVYRHENDGQLHFAERYSTDAATATGMYDGW